MPSPHAKFAQQYGAIAQRAGQRLGVDPSLLLTQWGLETGWGKSVIPGTNNLGNIKDFRKNSNGVTAVDNMNGSVDKYRKFATPDEFADHFAGLIERRYPAVIGSGNDANKFATALKRGGYAEDPDYVNKIVSTASNLPRKAGFLESMANFLIPAAHAAQPDIDPNQVIWDDEPIDASKVIWDDEPIQQTQNQQPEATPVAPQAAAQAPEPQPTAQAQGDAEDGGFWDGVWMGIRDPIDAGAQMLSRALDDTMVGRGVNAVGNQMAEWGLMAPTNSSADVDKLVNDANARYEAGRVAAGREGFDFARLGGNLAGTAPMMLANPAGVTSIAGRMGIGAAQGAGFGLLNPVIGENKQDNFWGEKGGQAALGGLLGGATAAATTGVGRLLSPKASRPGGAVRGLLDEGVELTPGQALGGKALWAEDKLMSVPIVGDAIRAARTRGNESLNRAAYNRVLKPIGETTDKLGREAIDDIAIKVSNAYDDVLSQVKFSPDAKFSEQIQKLMRMGRGLRSAEGNRFVNILNKEVFSPINKGQYIDGRTFKQIESQLGEQAKSLLRSSDANLRNIGHGLEEAQKALRRGLARSSPDVAKQLSDVNKAFAMQVRLQNAAGKLGADGGIFTPSQLQNAVRATDVSARKSGFARGNALMQDLADNARSVMNSQIPNSGTADRAMLAGVVGAGAYNPAIPIGLGLGAVPYLPGVNKLTTGLLTSRPQIAHQAAQGLNKLPPGLFALLGDYRN